MNNELNIVAIIQARMGSSRLPGKVLLDISGTPSLIYQYRRILQSKIVSNIIVATSNLSQDDAIAQMCTVHGIQCYRGSETDVLTRYYECAKQAQADLVIRITADCPLIDPEIIDKVAAEFLRQGVDYAANTVPPQTSRFPDGSDVEIFTFESLERAHKEVVLASDREHVTFYFWKSNNGFKTVQISNKKNWANYRITVDYPEDIEIVRFIVHKIESRGLKGDLNDIISILDEYPDIRKKNASYFFGIGWSK